MIRYLLVLFFLFFSVAFSSDESVSIKAKKTGEFLVVEAKNENPFCVTIAYNAKYNNLQNKQKFPMILVLDPNTDEEILKFHIEGSFNYQAHYDWTIGSAYARHDNNYIYELPFKKGTKRRVSQGYDGNFTHFGESRYAVDFEMPEGTEIYAAREGLVVKIKDDSTKGGETKDFLNSANYITIEHVDGTLATYAHLKYHGVIVKVAQRVKQGELIGYSGKTGMARGAHLHFIVYKAVDGITRESFPVKFTCSEGVVSEPILGKWYTAK